MMHDIIDVILASQPARAAETPGEQAGLCRVVHEPTLHSWSERLITSLHSQYFVPNEFVFRFLFVDLQHDQLSYHLDMFLIPAR